MRARSLVAGVAMILIVGACGNAGSSKASDTTAPGPTGPTTTASPADLQKNVPVTAPGVTSTEIKVASITAKPNNLTGSYAPLVDGIKASPVWRDGRTAIVIVWDENDYSGISTTPHGLFPPQNQNKVVLTVETNGDTKPGVQSNTYYNSFSLLRSLEAGFGLPCLNHACDPGVSVTSDLFGR